jgi:predicted pyridoxine 5'-phosphate oxidase superfamily flavin-nucleotide-binding protein
VTTDPPTPTGMAKADLLQLELSPPGECASPDPVDGACVSGTLDPHQPGVIPITGDLADPFDRPGADLPGSTGEHLLQAAYGSTARAERFYAEQVLDHLNPRMIEFIGRMDMAFVATSDARGECDCSLRAGPPGFIRVLDQQTVAYPEYRGNGVLASLGNISENAHVGLLLVDFVRDLIGLHVNGTARIVPDDTLRADHPGLPRDERGPERWVVVRVVEAYLHCRKHIPRLVPVERTRQWGTDDPLPKGGDYFAAKSTKLSTPVR